MNTPPRIALQKELDVLLHFMRAPANVVLNPSDVAGEGKRLSRPGAKASMERLAEGGMLKRSLRRPRNQKVATPHYSLPRNRAAFRNIALHYLSHIDAPRRWLAIFGMDMLDTPWARELLDDDCILEILAQRDVRLTFYLPPTPKVTDEMDRPFVEVAVQPSSAATVKTLAIAAKAAGNPLTDVQARGIVAARLTTPILSLVRTSPSALLEFLGEWSPNDNPTVGTMVPLEHVLFRLVFATLDDVSHARSVPGGDHGEIAQAAVCPPGPLGFRGASPLLTIRWVDGLVVAYRAAFDTDELVYGEELVVVENNPENCWTDFWYELPKAHPLLPNAQESVRSTNVRGDPDVAKPEFAQLC